MKLFFTGVVCLLGFQWVAGQMKSSGETDSLLINAYDAYRLKEYKKVDQITAEAIQLAQEKGDSIKVLRAKFYQTLARQSADPGNYDPKMIKDFLQAFQQVDNKLEMARACQFLAKIYGHFGNVTDELKYSLDALKLFEEINNLSGVAATRSNISLLYYDQHNYEEAFKNIRIGIEIEKKSPDPFQLNGSYNNLAIIFEKTGPLDSAIFYHKLALEQARLAKNNKAIGLSLSNLGNNYANNNQFELAETILQEALAIRTKYGSSKDQAYTHNRLANLYIKKGNLSMAKYHAEQSLDNAKKAGELKVTRMAYERLMEIAQKQGDAKAELSFLKTVVALKDSIVSESNTRELTQRMLTYEFERKMLLDSVANATEKFERELEYKQNLKTERTRKTAYLVTGLFFLLLAFTIYRRYQSRGKALEQAERVKEAYSQLKQAHEELKHTQSRLIHTEKMASLGEMTAGIAHEIQNPLNFVNNFSEVSNELITEMVEEVEKGNTDDVKLLAEDVKQNLEKILHHGKRADAIVKSMLQHSRGSSGKKEPTDINALCDEYLRLSYHGMRAKDKSFNASFETDFDSTLSAGKTGNGKINIMPQEISRVVLNLINNAFYACAERSRNTVNEKEGATQEEYTPVVKLQTRRHSGMVEITVKDNGNGMPEATKEKIFQPFFTTKPTGQGTGLGLSLSYDIVKAHDGEIRVETKQGEGSTFIIQIPINA